MISRAWLPESGGRLWVVGFCGGFTTFSSFSYDGLRLLQDERWLSYGLYTGGSVLLGLLATYLGWTLMRFV
jgi:CrcB protein